MGLLGKPTILGNPHLRKCSTLEKWDIKVVDQDAALWLARSAQEGLRSSVMGHLQGAKLPRSNKQGRIKWIKNDTFPKTTIAPENGSSQKATSIPTIHFQVL